MMLRRLIGEDIELVDCSSTRDLDPIKADPGQLEQVLMNLAVNARDAMPDGGRLTIIRPNTVLDEESVRHHPEVRPGPHVVLSLSDTGCGMDRETLARIFEPFFTTKDVGEGTGLGLSTVYGIVTQSGGAIEIESQPGHGTTVRVYLPSLRGEKPGEVETGADKAVGAGTETLLLVEDEAIVLAFAGKC